MKTKIHNETSIAVLMIVLTVSIAFCGMLSFLPTAYAAASMTFSTTPYEEYTSFVQSQGVTNIEDFVAQAKSYKFINSTGAEKTEDGNIYLQSMDWSGGTVAQYCRNIRIYGDYGNFVVRYKVKYEGKCMMLYHELRAGTDAGYYWSDTSNLGIMFRICQDDNTIRTAFSDSGLGRLQWDQADITLDLNADDYVEIEVGCIDTDDGVLLTLKLTNMTTGAVGYSQAKLTGTFDSSGFFALYNSPYNHCYNATQEENVMQDVTIEGIVDPALGKWVFNPIVDNSYTQYDISEIVPLSADGITYTYGSTDKTDSVSRALICAKVNKSNYSVCFNVKATNTSTVNFSLAMRSAKAGDTSGWKISVKSDKIQIGSGESHAVEISPDTEYKIEIGCTDYYIEGEAVASGVYVFVKINDELKAEEYIDPTDSDYKSIETGSYLTGILRGDKGGSLVIKPVSYKQTENTVTIDATRKTVNVGKTTRFSVETSVETLFDEVTYEIVEGADFATINENALTGVADGVVKVRAKVANAYGEFYSDAIEITVGTGSQPNTDENNNGGSMSTGAIIALSVAGVVVIAAVIILAVKLKSKKGGQKNA